MSNSKISALTSATTPLAGTEVLPIVQSSTTVKVATNDLTVRNIRANATTGILQVTGPTAAATRVMTVPDANFTAARTDAAQSFTGDQTLSTGNLVVGTSGKGITDSTGTNTLNFTSTDITANKKFNAASFRTITNSATIPGSSTATVLTLSSSVTGTYYVTADFGGQGNEIYSGMAIIVANAGSFRIVTNGGGTRSAISLSGANVQITNALGIALTAYAAAMFVGY
jgi:hypothetical protein